MSWLARFDPGDAVAARIVGCILQTSVVILLAVVYGGTVFRRRADARHALWLGALLWALISPAVATVVDYSGLALHALPELVSRVGANPAIKDHVGSRAVPRGDSVDMIGKSNAASGANAHDASRTVTAIPDVEPVRIEFGRAATPEMNGRGRDFVGGLTVLWASIALVGLGRMALGWRRVAELARTARALDHVRHGPVLEGVRAGLGIATLPPILTSPRVGGPVAIGLRRPCVVLPEGLAEVISSDSLRDVLVHECAHVARRDGWLGLAQQIVGVLLWPHVLVHYANKQLTRAREEICDNYVLRRGDPHSYARTLLCLTEHYNAFGNLRSGLGLLASRWTLADRIGGLLDSRRILMTRTTLRTRLVVAVALGATGLIVTSLRFDRPARGSQASSNHGDTNAAGLKPPKNAVWSIAGTVVDEQGSPVEGAIVHAREEAEAAGARTTRDGRFTLWSGHGNMYTRELVAELDGGARMGRMQFVPPRQFAMKEPVRLVLKPAQNVKVRVKDGAGAPISGAAIEAFDFAYSFRATTGPNGLATVRVPTDAHIRGVIGLASGAGFDYFENYRSTPPSPEFAFPPLPAEISLTLDGARTVRIRVVDPTGRAVPGVVVHPFRPRKAGKIETIEIAHGATTGATTDAAGVATFDWLPKSATGGEQPGAGTFFIHAPAGFVSTGPLRFTPGGPTELTVRLQRSARLTGTVKFPDGRPARGMLVIAGLVARGWLPVGTRTDDDGRYVFDPISPGTSRMIVLSDDNWASPSVTSEILKDGQEQRGLDFTLMKGTLVSGKVVEGPDHVPAVNVGVGLNEDKGALPKELRTVSANTYRLSRTTYTDAQGHYQLRVGPGQYQLATRGGAELDVQVHEELSIVRDLVAKARASAKYLAGIVVEKTQAGDRPVAGALVFRWPVDGAHKTDSDGRFMVEQTGGESTLYVYSPDKGLAGFATVRAGADSGRVAVTPTGSVSGRVIDSDGKPRVKQQVRVQLARDAYASTPRFAVSTVVTDSHGRFTYREAPVGSAGEFEVFHGTVNPTTDVFDHRGPRTVVAFEILDMDKVEVPDLVVPADRRSR